MRLWRERSLRKPSGGRHHAARKKKARDMGPIPLLTKIMLARETKPKRLRGGRKQSHLTGEIYANLIEQGKARKVKVISVIENPASRHFVRQNLLTKGAIVKTEAGLVRVTSRPSREGVVNAVLVSK